MWVLTLVFYAAVHHILSLSFNSTAERSSVTHLTGVTYNGTLVDIFEYS